MYKQVAKITPVGDVYKQQLIDEGTITEEEYLEMKKSINLIFEENYKKCKDATFEAEQWQSEEWEKIHNVTVAKDLISGVDQQAL